MRLQGDGASTISGWAIALFKTNQKTQATGQTSSGLTHVIDDLYYRLQNPKLAHATSYVSYGQSFRVCVYFLII